MSDYVIRTKANFFVCGHIHEAAGISKLENGCIVLNAGAFGQPFPRKQLGFIDTETNQVSHLVW